MPSVFRECGRYLVCPPCVLQYCMPAPCQFLARVFYRNILSMQRFYLAGVRRAMLGRRASQRVGSGWCVSHWEPKLQWDPPSVVTPMQNCAQCPLGTFEPLSGIRLECTKCPNNDMDGGISVPQTTTNVGSATLAKCHPSKFTSPYLGTSFCTGSLVQLSQPECSAFAAMYEYDAVESGRTIHYSKCNATAHCESDVYEAACGDKLPTCTEVVSLTGCDEGMEVLVDTESFHVRDLCPKACGLCWAQHPAGDLGYAVHSVFQCACGRWWQPSLRCADPFSGSVHYADVRAVVMDGIHTMQVPDWMRCRSCSRRQHRALLRWLTVCCCWIHHVHWRPVHAGV